MDFHSFSSLADEMVERIPPELLQGLNGGIVVRREARRRADDPPGVYLLGEYVQDPVLGAFIVLYHGSFRRVLGGSPPEQWARELWDTLRHELRHHVEARAGVRDLELEDEAWLQQAWEQYQRRRPKPRR